MDPHLQAVQLVSEMDHPTEGSVKSIRPTVIFDGETAGSGAPARPLGSDTREVLTRAGIDDSELDSMVREGGAVVGRHSPPSMK
jgi:crotonobetainyl-CoA:carnitine CoA-transferase CaiB-like acyl-CoA transferase